jgi:hypothetical protein
LRAGGFDDGSKLVGGKFQKMNILVWLPGLEIEGEDVA